MTCCVVASQWQRSNLMSTASPLLGRGSQGRNCIFFAFSTAGLGTRHEASTNVALWGNPNFWSCTIRLMCVVSNWRLFVSDLLFMLWCIHHFFFPSCEHWNITTMAICQSANQFICVVNGCSTWQVGQLTSEWSWTLAMTISVPMSSRRPILPNHALQFSAEKDRLLIPKKLTTVQDDGCHIWRNTLQRRKQTSLQFKWLIC